MEEVDVAIRRTTARMRELDQMITDDQIKLLRISDAKTRDSIRKSQREFRQLARKLPGLQEEARDALIRKGSTHAFTHPRQPARHSCKQEER